MNRNESILLCSQGIAEKRNGNYSKALEFYSKAQLADTTNQDVYYNFGKIHIGLGNSEEAMKHLLVYLHLSIYNNITIDPITGNRFFKNMLGFDYDDPIKQQVLMNNFGLFDYINKYGKGIITDMIIIPEGLIKQLCLIRPPLQLCVLDHNLSFYAGFCYVVNDKVIQIFNDITEEEMIDIKNGLLSKQYKNLLRTSDKEKLFFFLGLMYLAINLKRIKNIVEIPNYYLNKDLQIKTDIQNFKIYLESPDSI